MTKMDLVNSIYSKVGFSKKDSLMIVENVLEIMKSHLEQGEKIKISGFGNFVVREKRPRRGRNPQTGDQITIEGRRILTFKPSNVLRRLLNESK
ncbi:MAG: integration host factor subunit alpha [Deltaproteobacteria bacterium]|nr:MAG: integration host factor subunit alpha [Deltaproteobacteria bacterium]